MTDPTSIKGWEWRAGMAFLDGEESWRVASARHAETIHADRLPDLTDPATGGALLELLGSGVTVSRPNTRAGGWRVRMKSTALVNPVDVHAPTLGEACVLAASAIGRWPGGAR